MPIPIAIGAALLSGGISLGGDMLNNRAQRKQNELDYQFTREMYERQLQDNLEMWQRQNAYNSPKAQMDRLKEAGLNPHLMYGKGTVGNANDIGKATISQGSKPAPKFNLPQAFANYNMIRQGEQLRAQTDNLKTQNQLLQAQELGQTIKNEQNSFDLRLKETLRDTAIQQAEANLKKTKADVEFTTNQDARAELSIVAEIALKASQEGMNKAQEEYLRKSMEARIKQVVSQAEYSEIEAALAKQGFMRNDGYDTRMLAEVSTALGAGKTVAEILKVIYALRGK